MFSSTLTQRTVATANPTTHPMSFVSGVFSEIGSIERVDWPENAQWPDPIGKESPYLFGSSSGPRIKPPFAPLMFAEFAGLLAIGWARGMVQVTGQ
jgi:hypothetical protein